MRRAQSNSVRFGPFTLDLKAGELHKDGRRIRLQEKPFRILEILIERAGEIVTREELRKRLWPNDTIVEFDHSINAAVKRLRDAMGDTAEEPKYVETVARRGYRLISPVEWDQISPGKPRSDPAITTPAEVPAGTLIGKKVSHYRVLEMVGGGGMGVVYKAQDVKLGRNVALKFLPEEVANDYAAMERFQREARAASSLNHPNICTIYEFGEYDDRAFIAMELLNGQTIRQAIQEKAFSTGDLLDLAVQIAKGLQAAHTEGIIHRDIKPANIFITTQQEAKILDFGLAKVDSARDLGNEKLVSIADTPTLSEQDVQLTRPGQMMGTACYMSPEQVRGEKLDARTDLFSFGLVLYEMATGRQAYTGTTTAEVHQKILNHRPAPIPKLNPQLPSELVRIIGKAFEKDRNMRYQSAFDLRRELETLRHAAIRPLLHDWRLAGVGIAVLLVFFVAVYWAMARKEALMRESRQRQLSGMKVKPLNGLSGSQGDPTFSPDGAYVAFAGDVEGNGKLNVYAQVLGEGKPLQITRAPDDDLNPAYSPDGRYIAFIRHSEKQNGIFIVSALGGSERKVHEIASAPPGWNNAGLAWSADGSSLLFPYRESAVGPFSIYSVDIADLKDKRLTSPPVEGPGDWGPAMSPDGSTLAFVRDTTPSKGELYVLPMKSGGPKRLTHDEREIQGVAWTSDSRELVFASTRGGDMRLWRIPAFGGSPEPLSVGGDNACCPAIARHGDRLAYVHRIERGSVWRAATSAASNESTRLSRFIHSSRGDISAEYSPDGQKIVFISERSGSAEVWVCDSDGSNPTQLTHFGGPLTGTPRWSPDGRRIAFDSRPNGLSDIFVIDVDGGSPHAITTNPAEDSVPSWSRDGKWIYFASSRTGRFQVWKASANGGAAVQMTEDGGFMPWESADGKAVYYCKNEGGSLCKSIWTVPVGGGGEQSLLSDVDSVAWGWTVSKQGIYFANVETRLVQLFDPATRKLTTVVTVGKPFGWTTLSISPDRRWLLFTQGDQTESDIMLVEQFR